MEGRHSSQLPPPQSDADMHFFGGGRRYPIAGGLQCPPYLPHGTLGGGSDPTDSPLLWGWGRGGTTHADPTLGITWGGSGCSPRGLNSFIERGGNPQTHRFPPPPHPKPPQPPPSSLTELTQTPPKPPQQGLRTPSAPFSPHEAMQDPLNLLSPPREERRDPPQKPLCSTSVPLKPHRTPPDPLSPDPFLS